MDAITEKAVDSLDKKNLIELRALLSELLKKPASERNSSIELTNAIKETFELLKIAAKWAGAELTNSDSQVEISAESFDLSEEEAANILKKIEEEEKGPTEISDDEAKRILANANAPVTGDEHAMLGDEAAVSLENMDEAMDSSKTELNDDDAAAMLAQMDGAPAKESNEEMSDDDAAAMLSQMDAAPEAESSEEMRDDDAAAMLAQMDGAPAADSSKEMSDDDAAAMLAQMDGAPAAETSKEMSDDDAAAMLAQMDSQPETTNNGVDEQSADDEAAAMLAALEGGSPEEYKETKKTEVSVPSQETATSTQSDNLGGVEEIPEWEANDFQNDPDMKNDFIQNVDELMENLDESILNLESNPSDKEVIEEIFRAAHTLKGAAGMFGYRGMERVMHRMENLFDLVRKGKMVPDSGIIDVVFSGMDIIRSLIDAVKNGAPCGIKTAKIVYALELVADGKSAAHVLGQKTPEKTSEPEKMAVTTPAETSTDENDGKPVSKQKKKEVSTIRVDLNRLDALVNLVGELVIDRTRFATIEEDLRQNHPEVNSTGKLSDTLQMFGRHMNEIQDIIMKVRMVPIGNAFNKYPRIIRDLARTLGKEIDLIIDGETTELDKTLVEQIGDPLVHLIRNACDHGVEMPEDRVASGKKKKGQVFLSARQEGNHIIIEIEDDGKGMDADIIRNKAIEKGLITEEDTLSNREIFSIIFEPGFSTAEKVTTVSGRGVGMDVVKKQISKLKGNIEIDSTLGKGSKITIQLPLTLAIVQSLLVTANSEIFAIPLSTVVESIRVGPSEIQKVGDQEVIKLRDRVLPLMHLENALNLHRKNEHLWYISNQDSKINNYNKKSERLFVVVVGSGEKRFGIVVDQLLNQQEMVIKSMGKIVKEVDGVAGGAVLGNGEVVLVLDIPELENKFKTQSRQLAI